MPRKAGRGVRSYRAPLFLVVFIAVIFVLGVGNQRHHAVPVCPHDPAAAQQEAIAKLASIAEQLPAMLAAAGLTKVKR